MWWIRCLLYPLILDYMWKYGQFWWQRKKNLIFFPSLVHFLSCRHTCCIVGLITGTNSVIKKIHKGCIEIQVLKIHWIQHFAPLTKSGNYSQAVLRARFALFALLGNFSHATHFIIPCSGWIFGLQIDSQGSVVIPVPEESCTGIQGGLIGSLSGTELPPALLPIESSQWQLWNSPRTGSRITSSTILASNGWDKEIFHLSKRRSKIKESLCSIYTGFSLYLPHHLTLVH